MSHPPSFPIESSVRCFDQPSDLELIANEYAELLEQGQSTEPDMFVMRYPNHGPRLLELLKSIRWIQLAARDLEASDNSCTTQLPFNQLRIEENCPVVLGDYRLLREVGRGGMGIVYEAEQISLSRRVAIKILAPSGLLNERHIARFAMESQAAAQLRHPHIVPVYAVGCEAGINYYSLQLIEGRTPVGVMAPDKVAELGACVADALDHSHQLGIIHRDIKPSNLLIDTSGKVWVTDFGLARCRQIDQATASGAVLGTLQYMSPEQASGSTNVDHRTDIYSLGVTMYELLTGRCPVDARSAFNFESVRSEPTRLRKLVAAIPQDLETIVHKALSTEPQQRYSTAKAMAEDLQRFIKGEVILARRPTFWDCSVKWLSRNRRLAMVAAVAWSLISIVAILASMKLLATERESRQALQQTRQSLAEADIFFSQAREVVDHFGVTLAKQLSGIEGAESMRLAVLQDTLRYYRSFMSQAERNPMRQRDVAVTYMKLGGVAEQLEAYEEAIEAYEQSECLWQSIAPDDPKRAICANMLGLLLSRLGKWEQADLAFGRAVDCNQRIVSLDPDNLDASRHLAISLTNRYASRPHSAGDRNVRSSLATALALQESLLSNARIVGPMRIELTMDKGRTCAALAANFRASDISMSRVYSQSSIDCFQSVVHESKASVEVKQSSKEFIMDEAASDLVLALCNHAAILCDSADTRLAIAAILQATEVGSNLCVEAPKPDRRFNLAVAFHMLARLRASQHEPVQQLKALQHASHVLAGLVQSQSHVVQYHSELAAVSHSLLKTAESLSEFHVANRAKEEFESQNRWLREHTPNQVSQIDTLTKSIRD